MLIVTRLDRLARSTRDLLNILDAHGEAGAGFKSLGDAWADTTTSHGRLMLTVLGGTAEFERELIIARTGEGRAEPRPGREIRPQPKLTPHQRREAIQRLANGLAQADVARSVQRIAGDDLTAGYSGPFRRKPGRPKRGVQGSVLTQPGGLLRATASSSQSGTVTRTP